MPLILGRETNNSLQFNNDQLLSKKHCRFDYVDD